MNRKGSVLAEAALSVSFLAFLFWGIAFVRHVIRFQATVFDLCEFGTQMAAHPDLTDAERNRLLKDASVRAARCSQCAFTASGRRFASLPSARFYDFWETSVRAELGHDRLRWIFGFPRDGTAASVVLKEPGHDPA